MNNSDDTMMVMQALAQDVQTLGERLDFFEGIIFQLLVGLKEAGIIVDPEEEVDDSPLVIAPE